MNTLGHALLEQVRYRVLARLYQEHRTELLVERGKSREDVETQLWVHLREKVWTGLQ